MGIDRRAIVNKDAQIGNNVTIGPFSIIGDDVFINDGTEIGANVYIESGTKIGKNCKIFHNAVLGTIPQDLKFEKEKTTLEVGDGTIIREFCSLNRGTKHSGKTKVGKNCFLMMYVHIAHDCQIGNNVVIANATNMAGHVEIHDYANISGLCPIHQFVKIGKHSFIGGGYRVQKDVPPYILASGEPLSYIGPNIIGLARRGFSKEVISRLKEAYRIIYKMNLNVSQAVQKIKSDLEITPEIKDVLDFIEKSERGII